LPNSLTTRIKKLWHDGKISEVECKELLEQIKEHDEVIIREKLEKVKKDLIEEVEDYKADCDNDADDDMRCLRCNVVMFNSIIGMVKGVK
jgi:hypothetical protein